MHIFCNYPEMQNTSEEKLTFKKPKHTRYHKSKTILLTVNCMLVFSENNLSSHVCYKWNLREQLSLKLRSNSFILFWNRVNLRGCRKGGGRWWKGGLQICLTSKSDGQLNFIIANNQSVSFTVNGLLIINQFKTFC